MALVMRQCGVKDDWIPGLQTPLTIHDLRHGRKYHNELPYGNEDQDHGRHLESLRQLLEKFDVQDIFGLVDKHKHFDVPHDSHLIGIIGKFEAHPETLFYLIRTVADKTFNPNELCGHKFTYIPGEGLRPYEFHQGPLLARSKVDPEFFSQFTNYLNMHNITSIGLEYVIPQLSQIETHEISSEKKKWMIQIAGKSGNAPNPKRRAVTSWRWPKSKKLSGPATDCDKDPDGQHVGPDDLPAEIYRMLDQMCLI
jgi:hypothetical protein